MNTENPKDLALQSGELLKVAEARVDAQINFAKMILKQIAKHIRPTDVRVFGENLHFERAAIEQIMDWAGISIKDTEIKSVRYDDDKGMYYDFEAWGTVSYGGREIRVMGNNSTRADFYGTRKNSAGELEYLPLSEVDVPSVKQAAITNLMNHAVVRAMGLKSITLDDLKEAGMNVEKIERQEYKKGSKGGSTASPEEAKRQTEMWTWLVLMNGGDLDAARKHLVKATEFKGSDGGMVSKDNVTQLTGQWLNKTYGKLKAEVEAYCKKNNMPVPTVPAASAALPEGGAK